MRLGKGLIGAFVTFLVILALLQVFFPSRVEGFEGTPASYDTQGNFCVSDSQCGNRQCNRETKTCA
jgi:hypothetical protein